MNEFWNFSVRAYARSGVKSACLTFQSAGLDVNVGLWIIWICVNGRDPGPALDQAVALSARWNARVVKPLRQARDTLKSTPKEIDLDAGLALRNAVLNAELEAERLEQLALGALARSCPEHGSERLETLVMSRMQDYAARLGVSAVVTDLFVENVFGSIRNT